MSVMTSDAEEEKQPASHDEMSDNDCSVDKQRADDVVINRRIDNGDADRLGLLSVCRMKV